MKTKQLLLIALLAVVALLAAGLVAVRSLDTEEADSASDEIDLVPFAPADIEARVQEDTREYSLEEDEWSDADAPDYNHNYCYILSFNEEK